MRSVPDTLATDRVAEIDQRLASIRKSDDVCVLWAIESGSRAWGFPSPDSDYDCRFVFVRKAKDYLSPWPKRDVIETPLTNEIDLNGWDLMKAIKLLLKGNAVVLEWLQSPIIYGGSAPFRDQLLALATKHSSKAAIARHYLHLGERQRRTYFKDDEPFATKKLFYALRPAAALRWLRLHSDQCFPPMDFPMLIADGDTPKELQALVERLIADKAVTREMGSMLLPPLIRDFIAEEFDLARELWTGQRNILASDAREEGAELFRQMLDLAWRNLDS